MRAKVLPAWPAVYDGIRRTDTLFQQISFPLWRDKQIVKHFNRSLFYFAWFAVYPFLTQQFITVG